MKVHEVEQHSPEWFALRAGIVTASEADQLITPEFVIRKGAMPETYLCRKLAEKWTGKAVMSGSSWEMEQGTIREVDVIGWFSAFYDIDVKRVGFITTDNGTAGCSPDGLLPDGRGLEAKSPQPTNTVRYLLAGECPKEYVVQVQFCMYVMGTPSHEFVSYRPGFPPLKLTVARDEVAMKAIAEALATFNRKIELGLADLKRRNDR